MSLISVSHSFDFVGDAMFDNGYVSYFVTQRGLVSLGSPYELNDAYSVLVHDNLSDYRYFSSFRGAMEYIEALCADHITIRP